MKNIGNFVGAMNTGMFHDNRYFRLRIQAGIGFYSYFHRRKPPSYHVGECAALVSFAYPADAGLMTKLAGVGKKVVDYLKEKTGFLGGRGVDIDLKKIKEKARGYFFLSKNTAIEIRRRVFKKLHQIIKQQMRPVIELCSSLKPIQIAALPWNIRRTIQQINVHGLRYLLDVGSFIRTHAIKAGKALSFHASQVACIKKGKAGKEFEFGRVFQLGRIKGNFLFVLESTSVRMEDKYSLVPMQEEHAVLFGEGTLASVSTDKGYWSAKNLRHLDRPGIKEKGLQHPANIKNKKYLPPPEVQERLRHRRAGIEPLIGRTKHGGQLGRSRMKSDAATLAVGYSSVFGFNLRQLSRHQMGKMARAA